MSPNWMEEEKARADDLNKSGETNNSKAPKLVRVQNAPPRFTKGFYIQEKHARAFDQLVFNQKQAKGKKGPELAEEAIEWLLKKYGEKL